MYLPLILLAALQATLCFPNIELLGGHGTECKTDGACTFGTYCLDGKCAGYPAQGEPCGGNVRCAPFMQCSAGEGAAAAAAAVAPGPEPEWRRLVRRQGQGVCNYKDPSDGKKCNSPQDCPQDSFCSSKLACVKKIPVGGACDEGGCVGDNRCLVPGGSREGKCVPRIIAPGGQCGIKFDWSPGCGPKRDANGIAVARAYCAFPGGKVNPSIVKEPGFGKCTLWAQENEPCNGPEHLQCEKRFEFMKWEMQCSTDVEKAVNGVKPLGKCIKVTKLRIDQECCKNCLPCEDDLKCQEGFKNEWGFPIGFCKKK